MDKPNCVCGEELTYLMDNKRREIWQCTCGRLLLREKDSPWQRWYVPEAKLRGNWRLE